jgi:predicted nucleotidyltransferase
MVATVAERKARKLEHLRSSAKQVMAELRSYARRHHARFLVFGSIARDEPRFDSDFDVLVDFPPALERAARDYAEAACRRHGLSPDVHLISEASDGLMLRVRRDAVVLS